MGEETSEIDEERLASELKELLPILNSQEDMEPAQSLHVTEMSIAARTSILTSLSTRRLEESSKRIERYSNWLTALTVVLIVLTAILASDALVSFLKFVGILPK